MSDKNPSIYETPATAFDDCAAVVNMFGTSSMQALESIGRALQGPSMRPSDQHGRTNHHNRKAMKRWNNALSEFAETPKVDAFLQEIAEVCRKHQMSLAHEDRQGSFIVNTYHSVDIDWLMAADDHTIPVK